MIDDVIPEPLGRRPPGAAGDGQHAQDVPAQDAPRAAIEKLDRLLEERYLKFRRMGVHLEAEAIHP